VPFLTAVYPNTFTPRVVPATDKVPGYAVTLKISGPYLLSLRQTYPASYPPPLSIASLATREVHPTA